MSFGERNAIHFIKTPFDDEELLYEFSTPDFELPSEKKVNLTTFSEIFDDENPIKFVF